MPFSILTVCSGNICRSPLAQALLATRLAAVGEIRVASAGAVARDGDVATPQTASIGQRIGVDLASHRARYLDESIVAESDLLLGMSRSHRKAIVELVPRKVRSAFTLREFVRLAEGVTDDDLRGAVDLSLPLRERLIAAVGLVAARRGQTDPPLEPADDDIVDPYRHDDEVYRRMADQLIPAAEGAAAYIQKVADL